MPPRPCARCTAVPPMTSPPGHHGPACRQPSVPVRYLDVEVHRTGADDPEPVGEPVFLKDPRPGRERHLMGELHQAFAPVGRKRIEQWCGGHDDFSRISVGDVRQPARHKLVTTRVRTRSVSVQGLFGAAWWAEGPQGRGAHWAGARPAVDMAMPSTDRGAAPQRRVGPARPMGFHPYCGHAEEGEAGIRSPGC